MTHNHETIQVASGKLATLGCGFWKTHGFGGTNDDQHIVCWMSPDGEHACVGTLPEVVKKRMTTCPLAIDSAALNQAINS